MKVPQSFNCDFRIRAHCQYQQLFCNRGVLQEEYQVTAQEKLKKTITSTSQRLGLCVQLVAIILCKAAAILGKAGSNHLKSCPKECQYCHSDETNSSNFEKLVTLKGEEQATAALQMVMEEYSHTCRESCIDIFSRNIHRDDIGCDCTPFLSFRVMRQIIRSINPSTIINSFVFVGFCEEDRGMKLLTYTVHRKRSTELCTTSAGGKGATEGHFHRQ